MGRKVKTTMALDKDLLDWTEKMVELKRFASRTHAIEYALQRLREREQLELHTGEQKELQMGLLPQEPFQQSLRKQQR
jgi:Arc/MetJ-type ribon-helix-helix transcriptional regulator